ncbi:hypothetical protein FACS189431_2410 [Alphaproteobacteria bacterium]|nr:hypothetical protein FACS189431_2410 [Alphaproteobacteria bacterium]
MAGDNLARKLEPKSDNTPNDRVVGRRGNLIAVDFRQHGPRAMPRDRSEVLPFAQRDQKTDNQMAQLRQAEQASRTNSSAINNHNDIQKAENSKDLYNPTAAVNQNTATPQQPGARGFFASVGTTIKHNKGKFGGGIAGLVISVGIVVSGSLMAGPMSIIQAAEFIGHITDTMHDSIVATQLARTFTRTMAANAQNKRVTPASRMLARSYQTTLTKNGIHFIDNVTGSGRFSQIAFASQPVGLTATYDDALKLWLASPPADIMDQCRRLGGSCKPIQEWIEKAIKSVPHANQSWISKSKIASSMAMRVLNKMHLVANFHPIQNLTARAWENTGGMLVEKYGGTLENFVQKQKGRLLSRASKTGLGRALSRTASKVTAFAVSKGIAIGTTAVAPIPVIGWIAKLVGFAVGTTIGIIIRQMSDISPMMAAYIITSGVALAYQTTADQMKSGVFPTKTENRGDEPVTPLEELGLFSQSNLYREIAINDISNDISNDTDTWIPSDKCAGFDLGSQEQIKCDNEHSGDGAEVQNILDGVVATATAGISFWQSAIVQFELGNQYNENDGSVPIELLVNRDRHEGVELAEDIANSFIEQFAIASPDMFENTAELDPTGKRPDELGSVATTGGKVNEMLIMASSGGYIESPQQTAQIETKRKSILAEQFAEKPLLARLFDISDYRSSISTLAREANWDLSDQSIFAQIKNLAKTVVQTPDLIAKSVNHFAYASADAQPYNYGLPTIGFTDEQLENLPDYDDAREWVLANYDTINSDKANLEKYAGVKEITKAGEIIYSEDTDGEKLFGGYPADAKNVQYGGSDESDRMIRSYLLNHPIIMSIVAFDYDEIEEYDEFSDAEITELGNDVGNFLDNIGISAQQSGKPVQNVSDDARVLAQKLVDYANSGKITIYEGFANQCGNKSAKKVFEAIASGSTDLGTTCKGTSPTSIDINLLKFLVALAERSGAPSPAYQINTIIDAKHVDTSWHYEGKAVDFQCDVGGIDEDILTNIGAPYGVSNAGVRNIYPETCYNGTHWHFSTEGGH